MKLPYREGTWFTVPLRSRGFSLGVAARLDGEGTVFGYFFGPALPEPPGAPQVETLRAEEAVHRCQFGDLGLIKGEWPVLCESSGWDRSAWPLPWFVRGDEDMAWLAKYSDDLELLSEERCDSSLMGDYPRDSLSGSGAVEIVLTHLLVGATPPEPPGQNQSEPSQQDVRVVPHIRVADSPQITGFVESLLNDLERISEVHGEVTDTDVGESVHLTLSYFFVWGKEGELPVSYRMFSAEGNRAVADAVERFLTAVRASPELSAVPLGRPRLELLQNEEISTPGGLVYDDFFGHVDEPLPPDPLPPELYEVPDYD